MEKLLRNQMTQNHLFATRHPREDTLSQIQMRPDYNAFWVTFLEDEHNESVAVLNAMNFALFTKKQKQKRKILLTIRLIQQGCLGNMRNTKVCTIRC